MQDSFDSYIPYIKIHADSYNTVTGDRLTTFEISNFPKNLLAELNTHRVFSRNAASSRAIPVKKTIERLRAKPYFPAFTKNQRGMSGQPIVDSSVYEQAHSLYAEALEHCLQVAQKLDELGIHKEPVNRLLEPWMTVPVLVSSTSWDNFFNLRCAPDASPHLRVVALTMRQLLERSVPSALKLYQAHTLFDSDLVSCELDLYHKLLIIAARCARISYTNHGSATIDWQKDLQLANQLLNDKHLSPLEHVAIAVPSVYRLDTKNYRGFCSLRAYVEQNDLSLLKAL